MGEAPALRRILSIEDEADIREILRLSLEGVGGFQVAVCGSAEEAVTEARRFRPDLILLDVRMPDMDGPLTLQTLRALPETATTPVIFLTAKLSPQDLGRYRDMGALDVIFKPFDAMRLADALRRTWTRYHAGRG